MELKPFNEPPVKISKVEEVLEFFAFGNSLEKSLSRIGSIVKI